MTAAIEAAPSMGCYALLANTWRVGVRILHDIMVSLVMSEKKSKKNPSKMVVFKVALCLVYLCGFMIPWTSKQLLQPESSPLLGMD